MLVTINYQYEVVNGLSIRTIVPTWVTLNNLERRIALFQFDSFAGLLRHSG